MDERSSSQTVGRDGEGRDDPGLAGDGSRSGHPLHGNDQNAKASVHGLSPWWIGAGLARAHSVVRTLPGYGSRPVIPGSRWPVRTDRPSSRSRETRRMGSFGVTSIRVHCDRGGTADAPAALSAPDGRTAADTAGSRRRCAICSHPPPNRLASPEPGVRHPGIVVTTTDGPLNSG